MQITPINNSQTNFKGQMILNGSRQITSNGRKVLEFFSIESERIESIRNINPESVSFSKGFKTLIKTVSGDKYELPFEPKEVAGAKKYLDGTYNAAEPTGLDIFMFN